MEQNRISKAFSTWKIWAAVILGLAVAAFMMYRSLSEPHFVKTTPGEGSYTWVDSNHDGKVNFHEPEEFVAATHGNYNRETVSRAIASIDWSFSSILWLLAAIVFMFGRDLFYSVRIWVLCKGALRFGRSIVVTMIWEFASALSPGVVGGATVAMFILNREGIRLGRSTAIVVITAFMDNLFFVLMIPFVFMFVSSDQLFPTVNEGSGGAMWVFWTGFAVILGLCLFLFASIFLFPSLAKRVLGFIFRLPFLKKWRESALTTGDEIILTSRELRKERFLFWLKAFSSTSASWICRYLVINCILQAFIGLPFLKHILILGKQLILWLFMLVSPTPGASGVAEYAFGELLSDFAGSLILVTALAVIWRLISYFPYLIIGAIILPRWLRREHIELPKKKA